ncbi:hypothetical protein JCM6882_009713 [Rhodosporidiobolus microsporus]
MAHSSVAGPPPGLLKALKAGITPVQVISSVSGSTAPLAYTTLAEELQAGKEGWAGRVVLVTGGAMGIGREVAKLAGELGAKVVLGDLGRQEARLKEAVEEIKAAGGEATYAICDVTSWEEQAALFRHAFDIYSCIDVVFANAGITSEEPVFKPTAEGEPRKPDISTLDINLTGVVYTATLAQHYLPKDSSKGGKAFVVMGSIASFLARGTPALYAASKHGVLGLTRSLAAPFAASGISISLLAPFYVTTTILPRTWLDAFKAADVPLLDPLEVAQAGLWIAQTAKVDGKGRGVLLDHLGATAIPLEMVEWMREGKM